LEDHVQEIKYVVLKNQRTGRKMITWNTKKKGQTREVNPTDQTREREKGKWGKGIKPSKSKH